MPASRRSSARRRRRSSRRKGTRPSQRPLPFVGPGERLWVLDVPYGTQVEGASWHPAVTMHVHRSEEHTSELQSRGQIVWRLLPEKKNVLTLVRSAIGIGSVQKSHVLAET